MFNSSDKKVKRVPLEPYELRYNRQDPADADLKCYGFDEKTYEFNGLVQNATYETRGNTWTMPANMTFDAPPETKEGEVAVFREQVTETNAVGKTVIKSAPHWDVVKDLRKIPFYSKDGLTTFFPMHLDVTVPDWGFITRPEVDYSSKAQSFKNQIEMVMTESKLDQQKYKPDEMATFGDQVKYAKAYIEDNTDLDAEFELSMFMDPDSDETVEEFANKIIEKNKVWTKEQRILGAISRYLRRAFKKRIEPHIAFKGDHAKVKPILVKIMKHVRRDGFEEAKFTVKIDEAIKAFQQEVEADLDIPHYYKKGDTEAEAKARTHIPYNE